MDSGVDSNFDCLKRYNFKNYSNQDLPSQALCNKFNFVCIDNRKRDPLTNQINITLENGKTVLMPPNIYSVPALLMIKQNFKVVLGDDIMTMFQCNILYFCY